MNLRPLYRMSKTRAYRTPDRTNTRRMWVFGKARCVYRAREQGATTSNSGLYWEESQRSYRVREACIAAENSRVTGISFDTGVQ